MKPIGFLMREHRLIERMIALLRTELPLLEETGEIRPAFFEAIDFFRTYADGCHHGKEEDILFKKLAEKQLAPGHKALMEELIREHAYAREAVKRFQTSKESYLAGDAGAAGELARIIREFTLFYPKHIEKEDKHFFFPCLEYLSEDEQNSMNAEFREFDADLIHEIYRGVVEGLAAANTPSRPSRSI